MTRPRQIPPRAELTEAEIRAARYVGSGEHKTKRWWGGLPGAFIGKDGLARRPGKQLTTPCLRTAEEQREEASGWVRQALAARQFRFYEGDGTYPKHLRYKDGDGQYWFGFAVNQLLGSDKGWPIDEEEKRATFDSLV
jgi:hypothetical protein